MKKTALLAVAAAAFTATPALAAGGYVGVEHTTTDWQTISVVDLESLEGEFAIGFGGENWGAQAEGSLGNIEASSGVDVDASSLAGHLWYAGDNWRLGGVVARTKIDDFGVTEWAYGVEGTFDVTPNAVLFASITQGNVEDADIDILNFDLGASYYLTPNLRFGGEIGFGNIESDADIRGYRLNAEYQLSAAPISLTLGWASYDVDDGALESESISIGARWNFGGATLRDRDNITPFNASTGLWGRSYGIY